MTQNIKFPHTISESRKKRVQSNKWDTNIFFIFIYSGKLYKIAYLWVAKLCEPLRLAVNLKVKLESICAEVISVSAMTIKCQYVTCFIQRTGICQSLIMFGEQRRLPRTSEKCDVAHPTRTTSLKSLDSTNPQSDRLCTNGGNSRPLLPSREVVDQQRSLQSRTCNSLRGCKSSHWLMLMFMSPTSGEHWATMVCIAELQEKSHCFPKRTFLAKDHVDKPEDYWRKF